MLIIDATQHQIWLFLLLLVISMVIGIVDLIWRLRRTNRTHELLHAIRLAIEDGNAEQRGAHNEAEATRRGYE